jgi:hypothetical protein
MDDLIDCKKQSHDTNSFTEHQILDQCKTKIQSNMYWTLLCGNKHK